MDSHALASAFKDLAGWLLLLITFAVPVPATRNRQTLLLAIWFTLGLHHCAAIINCYVTLIPGGEMDAQFFHLRAAGVSTYVTSMPYDRFLAFVYQAMGASQFLGCELSILAYTLSVVVFLQLVEWVESERYAVPLVLLYGCLPGALFHCSVTMREAYQRLAMTYVIWMLVRLSQRGAKAWTYLGLLVGLLGLFLLHNGLAVLAIGLAAAGLLLAARASPLQAMFVIVALLGALIFVRGDQSSLEGKSDLLDTFTQGGNLSEYVGGYREKVNESARAGYEAKLDTSGPMGLLTSFPPVFFLYMYAPLPWQVSGLKDLYALSESALRWALTVGAVINILGARGVRRRRLLFLLVAFLGVEAMWSLGTANWGQAIRHRLVVYGLALLLGAEPILRALTPPSVPEQEQSR